ncbi:MAG TPA: glycoside hydrolase family 15 protein [Rhodothermales bacterium]
MPPKDGYLPIKDYAIIGDTQTAALVSRYGSIDWLCLPQFDSPSTFAALLDAEKGGRFAIHPRGEVSVERRYRHATAVLETTFRAATGVLRVTDLFTVAKRREYFSILRPEHEILRVAECLEGEVEVEVRYEPRPDYARRMPSLEDRGPHGIFEQFGGHVLILRSDVPLSCTKDGLSAYGSERLVAGDRRYVSLASDREGPAVLPLLGAEADERLRQTIEYWEWWSGQCNYDGPYRDAVLRSAITLKLLTYAESGAVVAAPTTSLPEWIGGVRNWDYRFCWPRDAAFTMRAFVDLGFVEEAESFLSWLTFAARRALPELSVLYDLFGGSDISEIELPHLDGYAGSRPVRIGNDARNQFQLDVYGEIASACHEYVQRGLRVDTWQVDLLEQLGDVICDRWSEPDNGIWEARRSPGHHTYSKVMCWVGLDRLIRLHEDGVLHVDVDRYRDVQRRIEEVVESQGFSQTMQSYTRLFGEDSVDASLLLLAVYGYTDAESDRMRGTFRSVRERLGRGALMYRYPPEEDDGLPHGEGTFGLCAFWVVEYLIRLGELDDAERLFSELLTYANDLGLFSEEIDPETGAALGNFPQAYTHVGVINAALTLAEARGRHSAEAVGRDGDVGRIVV